MLKYQFTEYCRQRDHKSQSCNYERNPEESGLKKSDQPSMLCFFICQPAVDIGENYLISPA
jgi:hypothetical protein